MKKSFKKLLALGLVLVMAVSCVACGSKEEAADAPAEETATEKKTEVSVRVSDGLITLDPFNWSMDSDHNIISNIYDTLYMMDDDTNEIPCLATDYVVGDDGLSYTFTLREGVVFSNGDPLTVNDVKYSIERYMTSAAQSRNVAGIESVDVDEAANTVTLNLSAPTPGLIDGLTRVAIANQKFVEENMDENGMLGYNACGTGPFMYDSHIQDVSCSIVANPNYWGTAPSLTKVNFMVVTDDSTALTALQAGDLDIARLTIDSWDNLVASGQVNTAEPARNHVTYITLNTSKAPFDNKLLRQAVACATNKEDINLMTQNGKAVVTDTFATPFMVGAPDVKTAYSYDVERAKALLAEAGYPDGIDVGELQVLSGGGYLADSGVCLEQQLAEVGITCKVVMLEANTLLSNLMEANNYTIATMGQTNTYDMSWMSTYFGSEHVGGLNMAQYSNPEVDAMLAEANTCTDPEKRVELYEQLLVYLDEECVYVPIYNVTNKVAWAKGLNYEPTLRPTLYTNVSWE